MADKKAEILKALRKIYPLPQDLITEVTTIDNAVADALHSTWMRRLKEDWKDERKNQPRNDGADIYNALHSSHVEQFYQTGILTTNCVVGEIQYPYVSLQQLPDLLRPLEEIIGNACLAAGEFRPVQKEYTKLDGSAGKIVIDPLETINMLLESVFCQPDAALELSNIDTTQSAISLVFGTSGVGKSARVLKLLTRRYGFYFSTCALTARDMQPSRDLDFFVDKVNERCRNVDEASSNTAFVYRYVPSMVAARLWVLRQMLLLIPNLSPGQFLMSQLFPRSYFGRDIFEAATTCYRRIPVKNVSEMIFQMKKEIEAHTKDRLLCCVDEAQTLCNILPGCFFSRRNNERRSLLSPFAAAAAETTIPLIFSGTGFRMDVAVEEGASPIHTSKREYVASIATDDDVLYLFSKYIGTSRRDLARLFRGRYRFSSFLIKAFVKKSLELVNGQDLDFDFIVKSVLAEIMHLLQQRLMDVQAHFARLNNLDFIRLIDQIKSAAVAFIWSGQPALLYQFGAGTMPGIQAGAALTTSLQHASNRDFGVTLFEKGFGLLEAYTRPNEAIEYLRVTLAEPLVAKFAKEGDMMSYPTFLPWNDSMIGFYTEHLYSDKFVNYLCEWRDIKTLVDSSRLPVGLDDFEIRIVTPEHCGGKNLLERVHTGSTIDWIESPIAERQPIHQPLTYLRPDGIGLFEIRWRGGGVAPVGASPESEKWGDLFAQNPQIVGLTQWKLRYDVSLSECLHSVDKKNIGVGKDGKVAARNRDEVSAVQDFIGQRPYLRIVMVYPHEFKPVMTKPRESLPRKEKELDNGINIVISGVSTALIL